MTAEEGLRRMDEIATAQEAAEVLPRAPLQLGPGGVAFDDARSLVRDAFDEVYPESAPAPREVPVRERPQAIFSRERFGAGGGPEPLRPRPVSRMTNADVLLRALSAPGTLFTLLQGGADTAMPGAKVLKVTAAPSMGPGGVVTIDVKEPRGRKPMRLTMRAGRPYWVWLGEVSLERPRIVPMFDPLLAPVMASSAPYAPVMAGLLQDVAVTPSPADYGLGRSRVDAYSPDGSTDRMRAGMVEIPTPRPAPLPPPPPAPRAPASLPPPPAPAAPRGMSNEELAAEFKRLMGGGKANGGHRTRSFR